MSATSNWRTIREKRVGNDPERVERAREAMIAELQLAALRKHRKASQADVAERLVVSQANVSQIERGDVKVSTVASYVDALGGKLELHAVFDDERIALRGGHIQSIKTTGSAKHRARSKARPSRTVGSAEPSGVAKAAKSKRATRASKA